jgi:predicted ArsR family transcriptional regulator
MDEQDIQRRITEETRRVENNFAGMFAALIAGMMAKIREDFGDSVIASARQGFVDAMVDLNRDAYAKIKGRTVHDFTDWIQTVLLIDHEYEIIQDDPDKVVFRFSKCPWADQFLAVDEKTIGRFFCEADCPMVTAFSDKLQFERTKTLMDGDDHCNHCYRLKNP